MSHPTRHAAAILAALLAAVPLAASAADAPPPPPTAEEKECHCDGPPHACHCKDGGCKKHHTEAPGAPRSKPSAP